MSEYILILLMSISIRSANQPSNPFDYEITGGLRGENNRAVFLYERENGHYYTGRDIFIGNKRFEFVDFMKSAKSINYQRFSFFQPLENIPIGFGKYKIYLWNFYFGLMVSLEKWKNPDGLAMLSYRLDRIRLMYAKGFEKEIIEIDALYEYKITKRFSLIPKMIMRKLNNKLFWQYKIQVEFRI